MLISGEVMVLKISMSAILFFPLAVPRILKTGFCYHPDDPAELLNRFLSWYRNGYVVLQTPSPLLAVLLSVQIDAVHLLLLGWTG